MELCARYRGGVRGHMKMAICDMIKRYIDVEKQFQVESTYWKISLILILILQIINSILDWALRQSRYHNAYLEQRQRPKGRWYGFCSHPSSNEEHTHHTAFGQLVDSRAQVDQRYQTNSTRTSQFSKRWKLNSQFESQNYFDCLRETFVRTEVSHGFCA